MSNHDNTNRGAIWPAKEKKTEKHPDYTGHLNVDGHEYFVSAWKKTGDNPKAPVLSFSVKRKDSMHPADYEKTRPSAEPEKDEFFDSDIPF